MSGRKYLRKTELIDVEHLTNPTKILTSDDSNVIGESTPEEVLSAIGGDNFVKKTGETSQSIEGNIEILDDGEIGAHIGRFRSSIQVGDEGITTDGAINAVGVIESEQQVRIGAPIPTLPQDAVRYDYLLAQLANIAPEWLAGTYAEGNLVTRQINSQLYLFKSTADSNTTEPLLNSEKEAWSVPVYGVATYVGAWSAGSYVAGNVVSKDGFAYYCLTNTNTDPVELLAPYWIKLGVYEGLYSSSSLYSMNDVVINGSNNVYLSNYNNNNYALNYGIVSKWEVINGQPNTTITFWGDSFTRGTGSTGYGNYPSAFSLLTGFNVDNQGVAGETSTQIRTRFESAPEKHNNPTIFWVGYNNNSDPTTVKADIAAMVAALGHKNYLVFEILKSNTDGDTYIPPLNADLKAIYKDRFVELQSYLVSLYNASYPQDVIDHANNDTPWSLRADWLHLNNLGYLAVAKKLSGYLEYIKGGEDTYKRHSVNKWVQVTDLQGIDRLPLEALELSYFESNGAGYVNAYDGKTNTTKILSLQYPSGSELRLVENGGVLKIGNISTYSSGVVDRLARVSGTEEIVFAPPITTGYIPFTDSNNNFITSSIFQNTSGLIGIKNASPQFELDITGIFRVGDTGVYVRFGKAGSEAFGQAYNGTSNIPYQQYTTQFKVGTGPVTTTANGEIANFDGEVKVAAAVQGTSAINLNQLYSLSGHGTLNKTANYTVVSGDYGTNGEVVIFVNATSGNITITLQGHTSMINKKVIVVKTDVSANSVTITGDTNISGGTTHIISNQYERATVTSNTNQYYLI